MPKNVEFVIYAYGIAATAVIVYSLVLFVKLKRVQTKLSALKDKHS